MHGAIYDIGLVDNGSDGFIGGAATVLVEDYGVTASISGPTDNVEAEGITVGTFATLVKDINDKLRILAVCGGAYRGVGKSILSEFAMMDFGVDVAAKPKAYGGAQ